MSCSVVFLLPSKYGICHFDSHLDKDIKECSSVIVKLGVVLKRALYFITCNGRMQYPVKIEEDYITRNLLYHKEKLPFDTSVIRYQQLSLFDNSEIRYQNLKIFDDTQSGPMAGMLIGG